MSIFGAPSKEWQVPPSGATQSRKLGWIDEVCQEGMIWQKSQRGYKDWNEGFDILSGNYTPKDMQDYRSKVTNNRLKTNINVTIAGLSAIRPWGGFQSIKAYQDQAQALNSTVRALYLSNFWDQSIKSALQWAAACCTGFIRPVYRRKMAGYGPGNIELDSFGMPSVLPFQMPANGDYQRAYAVTLMDEKPIWEAHGMFPDYQHLLKPTTSKYWYSSDIRKAAEDNAARRNFWNPFARSQAKQGTQVYIPFRYTTINDLSINMTGKTITMGQEGSPWSYEVPSYGQLKPNGEKASIVDARLYPFRRLMISSEQVVVYDGPAFNWHGMLDLIPFCLDRWPWEPMGFNMVHDGYRLQSAMDDIDRGTLNKINADMDRPLAYNINAVERKQAEQVDLMQPRQRVGYDGDAVDKPFQTIAPDEVYRISPEALAMRDKLKEDLDYLLQSRDIVELSKARALGHDVDQLEALISASGPLVKDMSRSMEHSVCTMAEQIKFLVFQYMDTGRVIGWTDGKTPLSYDYDPSSLVPSHLPNEAPTDAEGNPLGSPTRKVDRARWMCQNIPFLMTPHSIHEIHQMTYRLMLLQMKQRGMKIAECDIMEANDIPDVKHVEGNTTQERFWNEQFDMAEQMIKLQQKVQGAGIDVGQLLEALMGGKRPEGRPPTAQKAPHMEVKDGGRTTIAES